MNGFIHKFSVSLTTYFISNTAQTMLRAAMLLVGALTAGASALSKERGVDTQIHYPDTPFVSEDLDASGAPELDSSVSLLRLLGEADVEDLTTDASPHLHTYPHRFSPGHDLVVAWHHIPSPTFLDFVGIHCGTKAHGLDFSSVRPVGLLPGPVGSVRFKSLENRRCDWHAEYIRPSLFAVDDVSFAPDGAAPPIEALSAEETELLDAHLPGWRTRPPPSPARAHAPAALTWVRAVWARLSEIAEAAKQGDVDAAAEGMLLKKTLLEHLPTVKDFIKFHVIARKHVLPSAAAMGPHHVRLAAGNSTSEMWVSFTHFRGYVPTPDTAHSHFGGTSFLRRGAAADKSEDRGVAEYGTAPDKLTKKAEGGASVTYTAGDMCAPPATKVSQLDFSPPGHHHSVLLTGLESGVRYYYRVGGEKLGWSPVRSFVALPGSDKKDEGSDEATDKGDTRDKSEKKLSKKKGNSKARKDDIGDTPVRFIALSDLGTSDAPRTRTTIDSVVGDVLRGWEGTGKPAHPQKKRSRKSQGDKKDNDNADGDDGDDGDDDDDDGGDGPIPPPPHAHPPVSLALCVGDISYARGSTLLWDQFMRIIEPLSSIVPFHVTVGNHDYTYQTTERGKRDVSGVAYPGWHPSWGNMHHDSGGECGLPVAVRFKAPESDGGHPDDPKRTGSTRSSDNTRGGGTGGRESRRDDESTRTVTGGKPTRLASNGVFWYTLPMGPVLVIAMSSDHDWTAGSLQRRWLEGELAAADREKHTFVVVAVHRPLYTTQLCEDDEMIVAEHMRESLEPLIREYKVNLVLSGHQHSYERTCPVYNGACIPQPPRKKSSRGRSRAGKGKNDGRGGSENKGKRESAFVLPKDDFGGAHPSEWASVDPHSPPQAAAAATATAEAEATAARAHADAAAAAATVGATGGVAGVVGCFNDGVFGAGCNGGARRGRSTHDTAASDAGGEWTATEGESGRHDGGYYSDDEDDFSFPSHSNDDDDDEADTGDYGADDSDESSTSTFTSHNNVDTSAAYPATTPPHVGALGVPPPEDMHAHYDHVRRGTVHIVAGNGGAQAQPCGFSSRYGNFSVEHTRAYGYVRVTATKTKMVVEHVRTSDGSVHDRVSFARWKDEHSAAGGRGQTRQEKERSEHGHAESSGYSETREAGMGAGDGN